MNQPSIKTGNEKKIAHDWDAAEGSLTRVMNLNTQSDESNDRMRQSKASYLSFALMSWSNIKLLLSFPWSGGGVNYSTAGQSFGCHLRTAMELTKMWLSLDMAGLPIGTYIASILSLRNPRWRPQIHFFKLFNCLSLTVQGYVYAGAQAGQNCLCGNSYGKYGTSVNCNATCSGNATEMCGGTMINTVMRGEWNDISNNFKPIIIVVDIVVDIVSGQVHTHYSYHCRLRRRSHHQHHHNRRRLIANLV